MDLPIIHSSTSLGISQAHAAAVEAAQRAAGIQATAKKTVTVAPPSAVKSGQPTGIDSISDGLAYARTKAVGIIKGIVSRVTQTGLTTYSAKGVGDPQTLSLDSEIADGTTYQRVKAVSGNQCQTASLASGAVSASVSTSCSSAGVTTTEAVLMTLTLTSNAGGVFISCCGYWYGGAVAAGLTMNIRKGSVTGTVLGCTIANIAPSETFPVAACALDPSPGTGSVTYVVSAVLSVTSTGNYVTANSFAFNLKV
jgi:hypothetical protein